jgi:hypothetical protein
MMDGKVKQETSHTNLTRPGNPTITTLSRYKDKLKTHRDRFKESFDSMEYLCPAQGRTGSSTATMCPAVIAGESLKRDYRFILSLAQSLLSDCDKGIQIMMNDSVLHQSQKAIAQAKEVTKLTRLAFLYIPLSFVSSVFGMNVTLFGSGKVPIWAWAIVSGFVLALSLVFLKYDVYAFVRGLWNSHTKRVHGAAARRAEGSTVGPMDRSVDNDSDLNV